MPNNEAKQLIEDAITNPNLENESINEISLKFILWNGFDK